MASWMDRSPVNCYFAFFQDWQTRFKSADVCGWLKQKHDWREQHTTLSDIASFLVHLFSVELDMWGLSEAVDAEFWICDKIEIPCIPVLVYMNGCLKSFNAGFNYNMESLGEDKGSIMAGLLHFFTYSVVTCASILCIFCKTKQIQNP